MRRRRPRMGRLGRVELELAVEVRVVVAVVATMERV
jgi:hypothetical protein